MPLYVLSSRFQLQCLCNFFAVHVPADLQAQGGLLPLETAAFELFGHNQGYLISPQIQTNHSLKL